MKMNRLSYIIFVRIGMLVIINCGFDIDLKYNILVEGLIVFLIVFILVILMKVVVILFFCGKKWVKRVCVLLYK